MKGSGYGHFTEKKIQMESPLFIFKLDITGEWMALSGTIKLLPS